MTLKLTSALATTLICVAGLAQAETWKFSANDIDANYHTQNARQFAEDVAELSGGDLTIDVVGNAALLARAELKRGVQRGIVPMGDLLIGTLANEDPVFAADSIPLLATGFDQAQKLWDASRPIYEEKLAEQGLMILWAEPWPAQGIYMNDEVTGPDAFDGTKFRAYSSVTARFAELMGAIPTTIPSAEISQAFSTGVVEGMITSPTTGVDSQSWDFVEHFYDIKAMTPKNFVLVNKKMFDGLSPETQAAVLEAAKAAETRGWEMAEAAETQAVETLKSNGMDVQPTPEGLKAKLDEVGATMLGEWEAEGGEDVARILTAYRAQ